MSRIKAWLAILGALAAFMALPAASAFADNTGEQKQPGVTGPPLYSGTGGVHPNNGSLVSHK